MISTAGTEAIRRTCTDVSSAGANPGGEVSATVRIFVGGEISRGQHTRSQTCSQFWVCLPGVTHELALSCVALMLSSLFVAACPPTVCPQDDDCTAEFINENGCMKCRCKCPTFNPRTDCPRNCPTKRVEGKYGCER